MLDLLLYMVQVAIYTYRASIGVHATSLIGMNNNLSCWDHHTHPTSEATEVHSASVIHELCFVGTEGP